MSMSMIPFDAGNPEPERVQKLPLFGRERVIYVMKRGRADEPTGDLWKERMEFCMQGGRCAVCGDMLGKHRALLFRGPELIVNRLSDFAPMHTTCAFWLVRSTLLGGGVPMSLEAHPEYRLLDANNGGVANFLQVPGGRPVASSWWQDGQMLDADGCVQVLRDYEGKAQAQCETDKQRQGLTAMLRKALETLLPTA